MIRNITRTLGLGLGLVALTSATPLQVEECAVISVSQELYQIGEMGILAIEGPPGLIPLLYVSPDPDPILTSPFPPGRFDPIPEDGMGIVKAEEIACSTPDKWLQVALHDPNSLELVCVSNQIFLDVDHEAGNCDGNEIEGEGCTPGYWRQRHHYDSWPEGLTPDTLFSDVFADAFPGKKLGAVIRLKKGGLNALGRHTVAALLNASTDMDYGMTDAEVIALFDSTWDQSEEEVEALKDVLAGMNEMGCPLN
jgi:hypothetical protein